MKATFKCFFLQKIYKISMLKLLGIKQIKCLLLNNNG